MRFGKTRSFFTEFAYPPRSDLSVFESSDRIALAGKDQIKAFSLSKSDNHHIISYTIVRRPLYV